MTRLAVGISTTMLGDTTDLVRLAHEMQVHDRSISVGGPLEVQWGRIDA